MVNVILQVFNRNLKKIQKKFNNKYTMGYDQSEQTPAIKGCSLGMG